MAFDEIDVVRVRDGNRASEVDRVAVEEPLDVRLHGRPFAVIMRTPGADRDLAAGFLFAERVLRSADDVGTIAHCRDTVRLKPDSTTEDVWDAPAENVINVTLARGEDDEFERVMAGRRNVVANASCGVCGRLTIETLRADLSPVRPGCSISASALVRLPDLLRIDQPMFDATGGLHAAGLFDCEARLITSAEDVGRHNAVDKVVGRMLLREALPLADRTLFVSGRTSFEIVQKAWCAGIPIVASVSAPSSLAIALAREARITLVGFVRNGGFNIYAHPERIVHDD